MNFQPHQGKEQKGQADVIEYIDSTGRVFFYERYEGSMAVSDITHGDQYKLPCEGCPKYGKNLACPPYSPSFLQYVQGAGSVRVICIRLPTDYFPQPTGEARYRSCFHMARSILTGELLKYREQGLIIAGSGTCRACDICAVEHGARICRKPREKIYSLESLGVNVISLVKTCLGVNLDWSGHKHTADFVSAVGAVFLPE